MNLLDRVTKELMDIIIAIGPKFRDIDKNEIIELCKHDEQEIAFEVLCSQIGEFDIPISREIFERIEKLCIELNVDQVYVDSIHGLIINGDKK